MQFRVAAGQIDGIGAGWHRIVGQRREKRDAGAEFAQAVEIGRIEKSERGVVRNGNRFAFEQPGDSGR